MNKSKIIRYHQLIMKVKYLDVTIVNITLYFQTIHIHQIFTKNKMHIVHYTLIYQLLYLFFIFFMMILSLKNQLNSKKMI